MRKNLNANLMHIETLDPIPGGYINYIFIICTKPKRKCRILLSKRKRTNCHDMINDTSPHQNLISFFIFLASNNKKRTFLCNEPNCSYMKLTNNITMKLT